MTDKHRTGQDASKSEANAPGAEKGRDETASDAADLTVAGAPASARNMPRPSTSLIRALRVDIGDLKVYLLGDVESIPSLEEVEKVNIASGGKMRTPLLTVIQAVLAGEGSSMTLADLAARVRKSWNRPFPSSPYGDEEFIYTVITGSDNVRISEP